MPCICGPAGPGPGRYKAPTTVGFPAHDFTRHRGPAYSLGLKCHPNPIPITPGPYKFDRVNRNGRDPYIGYSIGIAHKHLKIPTQAGPADYFYQEKLKSGYSLGLKLKTRTESFGPGPAYYWEPKPKTGWTIPSKRRTTGGPSTPGPYGEVDTNIYKTRAPRAPIGAKGPQKVHETAGPGPAYYPKLDTKPGYSFGLRHPCCAPPLITYADNNTKAC